MPFKSSKAHANATTASIVFVLFYVAITVSFWTVQRTPLVVGTAGVYLATWALTKCFPQSRWAVWLSVLTLLGAVVGAVLGTMRTGCTCAG